MAYTTNFPVNPGIFIQTVISGATTNATSSSITNYSLPVTYQVSIAGTGTVSATVTIYGTATAVTTGGTAVIVLPISGTTSAVLNGQVNIDYPYYYAKITSITGTGAAVTLITAEY